MSSLYKIKEISRLYGLCTDTLRYYEEQGLLFPKRGANQYRMFSVQDIGTLNVIRSLRGLDVSLERIREYLESRTIDSTLALMEEEEGLIRSRIQALEAQYEEVSRRKEALLADRQTADRHFSIKACSARPCFQLNEDVILEHDIDFVLKKLEHRYEENIHVIGIKGFGARMDPEFLMKGIYNHFQSVFFLSNWDSYSSVIPEGEYASMYYWGEYERVEKLLPLFKKQVKDAGYVISGVPMEFYHIDTSDTKEQQEYLTEIQVKVEKAVPPPCRRVR